MTTSHQARRRESVRAMREADAVRQGYGRPEAADRSRLLVDIQDQLNDRELTAEEGLAAAGRTGDVTTLYNGSIPTADLRQILEALRALPGGACRFSFMAA